MSRSSKKSIFLIGKFNSITQSVNDFLVQEFEVQLCSDNLDIVSGMLDMKRPDLVVISLIGMDKYQENIFAELRTNYAFIPVVCIGTEAEQKPFLEYLNSFQFCPLTRPVNNETLFRMVCKMLKYQPENGIKGIVDTTKGQKKCVMVIDDNAMQLRSLKAILQGDYEVTMATSGAEAIQEIGLKKPDLIFLDYEMPVCDGKMTLEMIRNLENAKDIPVVFLTGVRDKEHISAVLRLKPAGYILKPASQERILDTAKEILDKEKEAQPSGAVLKGENNSHK